MLNWTRCMAWWHEGILTDTQTISLTWHNHSPPTRNIKLTTYLERRGPHESRSTHALGVVFILWCFWIYFIDIVYFHPICYGLFLYSKNRGSSLITANKIYHIPAPWYHSKHPLSCHNGYVTLSGLLYDVTMVRWRCHWYHVIKKSISWIIYTRYRKTWTFYTRSR